MCFKNCLISIAYIQVNLVSIFICKLYERLLALNHLFKYSNMVVMSLIQSVGLELVPIIPLTFANRLA
jgi:hypothetical protein